MKAPGATPGECRRVVGFGDQSGQASGAVALLEFLVAAAGARVVTTDLLERIANGLLRAVVAMRAMDVPVIMVVIVVAVWAVDMGLLGH